MIAAATDMFNGLPPWIDNIPAIGLEGAPRINHRLSIFDNRVPIIEDLALNIDNRLLSIENGVPICLFPRTPLHVRAVNLHGQGAILYSRALIVHVQVRIREVQPVKVAFRSLNVGFQRANGHVQPFNLHFLCAPLEGRVRAFERDASTLEGDHFALTGLEMSRECDFSAVEGDCATLRGGSAALEGRSGPVKVAGHFGMAAHMGGTADGRGRMIL